MAYYRNTYQKNRRSFPQKPVQNRGVYTLPPIDPSPLQAAIFANVATGKGHTVVMARAGTGKTTTILHALRYVPKGSDILLVAFNKSIADEITWKVSGMGLPVTSSTLHSFGLRAVTSAYGRPEIDAEKYRKLIDARIGDNPKTLEYRMAVKKAVDLARADLAESIEEIQAVCERHAIAAECDVDSQDERKLPSDAAVVLAQGKNDLKRIDFDDMIWFPVVYGLTVPKFSRVFIDETQDLTHAQLELCLKACRDNGRICAVGDDKQAIYGFRGAMLDGIAWIIERLSATVLPLSVTYRCPKAVVCIAQVFVPDYEAHTSAPEGIVSDQNQTEMETYALPGDFILSRTNAPLVSICLHLIKAGKKAAIRGRDVGRSIAWLVKSSKALDVPALSAWIDEWHTAEHARISAKKGDMTRALEVISDKRAIVDALCEGAKSVSEVLDRIASVFSVGDQDKGDESRITLSTTHKAKGLEAKTVYVLRDTYLRRPEFQEEKNLYYVAITRAKSELVMVHGVR